jgi:tRNA dimethylallyltransferase
MAQGQCLPPAIILSGPTAAGKTAVAMALHDRFDVDLISVDSAQVYRGLNIGAAKPNAEALARYPHALIDIRDPQQPYSAADFLADCDRCMRESRARHRVPVLVGGTTLYLRAALYGLDPLPPADPALRESLRQEMQGQGREALHQELRAADPEAAAWITPSDPQRLLRAIEVLRLTGRGPGHWQRANQRPRFDSLRLVCTPADRRQLHARIGQRFDQMMAEGFLPEARSLYRLPGFDPDLPAFRSVGYRQAWDLLAGRVDAEEFGRRVRAATRQLAKRQLTALRQLRTTLWYDSTCKSAFGRIYRQVEGFLRWIDNDAGGPCADPGVESGRIHRQGVNQRQRIRS